MVYFNYGEIIMYDWQNSTVLKRITFPMCMGAIIVTAGCSDSSTSSSSGGGLPECGAVIKPTYDDPNDDTRYTYLDSNGQPYMLVAAIGDEPQEANSDNIVKGSSMIVNGTEYTFQDTAGINAIIDAIDNSSNQGKADTIPLAEKKLAKTIPMVDEVTSFVSMFGQAASTSTSTKGQELNPDLSTWYTGMVTDMTAMFKGNTVFNQDLNCFDTRAVTNMASMFEGATAFNGSVAGLTSSDALTDVSSMFKNATSFNQPIKGLKLQAVITMASMFEGATSFHQNMDHVESLANLTSAMNAFKGAVAFNGTWKQDLVIGTAANDGAATADLTGMFQGLPVSAQSVTDGGKQSSFDQPLENWKLSAVSKVDSMFEDAVEFDQDISNWSLSSTVNVPSKADFATGSGIEGDTDKLPKFN